MTPIRQEDKKMKTEMKDNVGALVAGTVTLFGVTAASCLSKDD